MHVKYVAVHVCVPACFKVVKPDGTSITLYVAFIGVKGDWPWQRNLATI